MSSEAERDPTSALESVGASAASISGTPRRSSDDNWSAQTARRASDQQVGEIRFTASTMRCMDRAEMLAKSMAHAAITVEHLLVVLTLDHEATSILAKYRRDVLAVRRTAFQLLFNMLRTLVPISQGSLPMASDLFSTIMRASELAAQREVELRAISINDVLHVLYAENDEQQRSGFDEGQDKTFASREVANHELSLKDMTLQREFVNSLAGNSGHEDLTADSVDTARDAQQPEMRHRLEVLDAKLERSGAEQRQVSMNQAQATQQTLQELSELKRLLAQSRAEQHELAEKQAWATQRVAHSAAREAAGRRQSTSMVVLLAAMAGAVGFAASRYGAELQTLLNKLLALLPFASGASSSVVKGALLPTLLSGAVSSDQEDLVDCSVFGPSECSAKSTVLIQFFAHLAESRGEVVQMATAFDATAQFRGFDTLDIEIKRGDKLDIALDGQGIEVVDPLQHLTWRGRPIGRTFEAHIPEKAVADYHPVFRVSKNGALVGRIQFKISVRAGVSQVMTVPTKSSAKRYSHAFISYASEDRREVLKSAQMLKATKIEFFQDILSLDPGVRWEREIYRQIDKSDLFLLFWSNSAKNSEWVIKEALHALELQSKSPDGLPDIVPVILEGPPPVLPPDGLRNLHFDDRIRYFMA